MGQPMEYAMSSCVVAVRLGEAAGLAPPELNDTYHEALLRYIGCKRRRCMVLLPSSGTR
jgi:hypothetical protein